MINKTAAMQGLNNWFFVAVAAAAAAAAATATKGNSDRENGRDLRGL